MRQRSRERGFTVAELITVVVIIGLLASMAVPVARFGYRRQKEIDLHARIRKLTDAIDRYHDLRVKKMIKEPEKLGANEYPKTLDDLVKGVELVDGKKIKFIRPRDLVDPMTGEAKWDTRSNTDAFDASSTNGDNVFDIHSTSTALSLDGKTHYNEW